jgi:hypothetical protein
MQNHCQNITLNDHYNYEINFWWIFIQDIHIHLDNNGDDLIVSHYGFIENDSTGLAIFVQIVPYFNHKHYKESPKMQPMHLSLHATNCHLQLTFIGYTTTLHP